MKKVGKPKESEAFTRFREFAGKLVAIPKSEIDKQKAKHEREKEKRAARR